MKVQKTNAARLLDQHKISYQLVEYPVDENNLGATHVAEILGENVDTVYKTIVLHGDKTGYFVCVIPAEKEINLKLAAKASHNKNCELIPMKDLLTVTGYIRGGCSPIGMKKNYPIYLDITVEQHPQIFISGGRRGLQIKIEPKELINCCQATVTPLTD